MPKDAKRHQVKSHLWEVASNSDGSVVTVRLGMRIVAQMPGPLRSVLRLSGEKLAVATETRQTTVNLFTGEVT